MPTYTAGKPQTQEFLVPAGEYGFKVVDAKDDTSKKGNEMIELKLKVLRKDDSEAHSIFDYLVFTESSFWKVDAFLKSVEQHPGEGVAFDVKAEELIGMTGRFRLKIEKYDGKESNKVDAYLFEEF